MKSQHTCLNKSEQAPQNTCLHGMGRSHCVPLTLNLRTTRNMVSFYMIHEQPWEYWRAVHAQRPSDIPWSINWYLQNKILHVIWSREIFGQCRQMDGARKEHPEWGNPYPEKHIVCTHLCVDFTHIQDRHGTIQDSKKITNKEDPGNDA